MKGIFLTLIVVVFSLLAIPLSALSNTTDKATPTLKEESSVSYTKTEKIDYEQKIKVLKDGNVYEYSITDYIFGVVAAEMPALYEPEALKAQAVAAYTFACYKKNSSGDEGYDISADPNVAQCFISRDEALLRWGDKATEYEKKINSCISAVQNQMLTYDDKPIFAAYHAISAGTTNNCEDVWSKSLPYLVSVNSDGDCQAENYLTQVTFSSEEIAKKLESLTAAHGEAANFFGDIVTTDNGYVKQINYCGKKTTGSNVSKLLGLRSSNFSIDYSNDVFTFSVKGYGHGVGMSQTGADYLAKQGYSYHEILQHYYPGTKLENF